MAERHARLFGNGRNQAVRFPLAFELPGSDAVRTSIIVAAELRFGARELGLLG